jgi:hypothetical protein
MTIGVLPVPPITIGALLFHAVKEEKLAKTPESALIEVAVAT